MRTEDARLETAVGSLVPSAGVFECVRCGASRPGTAPRCALVCDARSWPAELGSLRIHSLLHGLIRVELWQGDVLASRVCVIDWLLLEQAVLHIVLLVDGIGELDTLHDQLLAAVSELLILRL